MYLPNLMTRKCRRERINRSLSLVLFGGITMEKGHWTGSVTRGNTTASSRKTPGAGSSEKTPEEVKEVFLLEPGAGA